MVRRMMTAAAAAKNQDEDYRTRSAGECSAPDRPSVSCLRGIHEEAAGYGGVNTVALVAKAMGRKAIKTAGEEVQGEKAGGERQEGAEGKRAEAHEGPPEAVLHPSGSSRPPKVSHIAPPLTEGRTLGWSLILPSCFFICKVRLI